MLDKNDYDYLNLLYDQLFKFNIQLNKQITDAKIDDLLTTVENKEKLINKIVAFEKPHIDDIKNDNYLYSKRLKIIEAEKQNIELVANLKDELRKKMNSLSKTHQLYSAYVPGINNTKSTFDIFTED